MVDSNSQYNLQNSIEFDSQEFASSKRKIEKKKEITSYSSTLDTLLDQLRNKNIYLEDMVNKAKKENIDRKGYQLKAPCQDVFGFLKNFAPASRNERNILEYMYFVAKHHKFIMKTQIMNEGWSMVWEKKIMNELFKEGVVKEVVDYCRIFSGVCKPRPFFARNPYHLGYCMWTHIEDLYKKGNTRNSNNSA